jgi:hypothetical protein
VQASASKLVEEFVKSCKINGFNHREACFGKGKEPLQDLFLAKETLMPPLPNSDIRHVKACGDAWEMCEGDNTDPHASCTLSPHCFVMREATSRTRTRKIERPADDVRGVD